MRLLTPLVAAAVLLPLPVAAQALPARPPAPPLMTVTGSGTVTRAPDQATVDFAVVTNDDAAARAASENNRIVAALGTRLAALGIPASAVRTVRYGMSFNPRPPQPNPQFVQRYGYVVTRALEVTSARTGDVGAIVDAGVAAGATNVEQIAFGLHDPAAAYREALAVAVADAEAQARALAAAAHVRLGALRGIAPSGTAPSPIRPLALARAAAPNVPTEIPPGDLTVRASVTLTYAFAP